eukprot:COSAG05_NODE_20137_length_282_cov_1.398907_1_plen_76_part_01
MCRWPPRQQRQTFSCHTVLDPTHIYMCGRRQVPSITVVAVVETQVILIRKKAQNAWNYSGHSRGCIITYLLLLLLL